MSKKLKFFLDTEFIETGRYIPLHLLSIGIVSEFDETFYAESFQAPFELANDWVKENVFPHLRTLSEPIPSAFPFVTYEPNWFGNQILKYIQYTCAKFATKYNFSIDEIKPEFWGYFCDYDWVLFCQLFGTMVDLPKGFPYYCNDLKQLMKFLGEDRSLDELTDRKSNHNALSDAKQIKEGYERITNSNSYKSVTELINNLNRLGDSK
jgi:hypothetical protein